MTDSGISPTSCFPYMLRRCIHSDVLPAGWLSLSSSILYTSLIGYFINFIEISLSQILLVLGLTRVYTSINRLSDRMGIIRRIGTTLKSTEAGRSPDRSQVAAGAKYGEFVVSRDKSHDFSPEKRWSKCDNANHGETLGSLWL